MPRFIEYLGDYAGVPVAVSRLGDNECYIKIDEFYFEPDDLREIANDFEAWKRANEEGSSDE